MFSRVRGVGGFPLTAIALALGIWGLSGRSAMAQGGDVGGGNTAGPGGGISAASYAYVGPTYGAPGVPAGYYVAPPVGHGPGYGIFAPVTPVSALITAMGTAVSPIARP